MKPIAIILAALPLFAQSIAKLQAEAQGPAKPSQVETALATVKPDELTPKAALELIYRLKELAAKG